MDFAYSTDQEAWRDVVAAFLDDRAPLAKTRVRAERGDGPDTDLWRRMADLGLHGLHVPEHHGGQGFGVEELAIVQEEMGARLVGTPYVASTVLAATLLAALADAEPAAADLLARVATGDLTGTVALWGPGTGWVDDGPGVRAAPAGAGTVTLTGTRTLVPYGADADLLLVTARHDDRPALVAVTGAAAGLDRRTVKGLDLTTRYATVTFTGTHGVLLAEGEAARAALDRLADHAYALLAAEMVGGARACLENAVEYAGQRHQFGRPIGSFQAVKHLCADMLAELELARSAVLFAVWAVRTGDPRAASAASTAKALAGDAYLFIADAALHIHGGMGFTWEHDSHLYLRRARAASLLFGDAGHHRERFLRHAGFGPDPVPASVTKGTP
ncbi:acyl-CoA dehydrogenase family protein [Polymorphospora sp. NPDC051019]|uniref:acyl-CoA dehydrogenase family protein n=1 Tax=Polymorphospora sp. NPDC051019 TaxID=3155725 RepID=UPI003442A899